MKFNFMYIYSYILFDTWNLIIYIYIYIYLFIYWKRIGRVEVKFHSFLPAARDWGECSASRSDCFLHKGRAPGTCSMWGLVGLRTSIEHLGEEVNLLALPGFEHRFIQPVSFVPYWLRYLGSCNVNLAEPAPRMQRKRRFHLCHATDSSEKRIVFVAVSWCVCVCVCVRARVCVCVCALETCRPISFTNFNAQFLYSLTICMLHYIPRHVSSINMPIFRRTNSIITASGIVTLCKRLYGMPDENRQSLL